MIHDLYVKIHDLYTKIVYLCVKIMYRGVKIMYLGVKIMYHTPCIMHHVSCITYPASIQPPYPRVNAHTRARGQRGTTRMWKRRSARTTHTCFARGTVAMALATCLHLAAGTNVLSPASPGAAAANARKGRIATTKPTRICFVPLVWFPAGDGGGEACGRLRCENSGKARQLCRRDQQRQDEHEPL